MWKRGYATSFEIITICSEQSIMFRIGKLKLKQDYKRYDDYFISHHREKLWISSSLYVEFISKFDYFKETQQV